MTCSVAFTMEGDRCNGSFSFEGLDVVIVGSHAKQRDESAILEKGLILAPSFFAFRAQFQSLIHYPLTDRGAQDLCAVQWYPDQE